MAPRPYQLVLRDVRPPATPGGLSAVPSAIRLSLQLVLPGHRAALAAARTGAAVPTDRGRGLSLSRVRGRAHGPGLPAGRPDGRRGGVLGSEPRAAASGTHS